MAFNPYESARYQSLGRNHYYPVPESEFSAFISGYISVVNEAADIQKPLETEERNRQGWYMSQDRRLHSNARSALEGGLASDMINGERDCAGSNWQF